MYSVSTQLVMGRPISAVAPHPDGQPRQAVREFGVSGEITTSLVGLRSGALGPTAGIQASRHGFAAESGALLLLDLAFAARISNLAFDGKLLADFDLAVFPRGNGTTTAHAISIRGCRFRGARLAQVQLGPRRIRAASGRVAVKIDDPAPPMSAKGTSSGITQFSRPVVKAPFEQVEAGIGDMPGFSLERCTFECNITEPDGDRTVADHPPRGMLVRASNGVAMRVAECAFRGVSPAFIDVSAGMLLVDRCRFDNASDVVGTHKVPPPSTPGSVGNLGFEEPLGVDVYLGAEGVLSRAMNSRSAAPTQGYVALTSCRSSSTHSHFATPRPSPLGHDRPTRSNLILGCVHAPARVSRAGPNHPVISVRWGRGALTRIAPANRTNTRLNSDATLCVVGSHFGGDVWIDHGAAQSVLVACRVRNSFNLPLIQTASGEYVAIGGGRRPALAPPPSRIRTVVFGLQYLAAMWILLLASGCHSPPSLLPIDASADSPASITDQPQDRLDAGGQSGVDAPDVPRPPPLDRPVITPDVIAREDITFGGPDRLINELDSGYNGTQLSPRDVIQRDIEIQRVSDVPFVTEYSAPTQMRAPCPEVSDGEPGIAAPRLVFPLSPMRVTSQRPTLMWSLPAGVDGARIELCRDRCCTQPIAAIDATGTSVRPPETLAAGVVFWRARGRVGARFGRETSFTWEFGVKHRDASADTAWGTIKDFNGDGYDDLVNSIYSTTRLQTRIYWGGRDGIEASRFWALDALVGSVRARGGDFNGDGLADAAIGAHVYDITDTNGNQLSASRLTVVYGNRGPLGTPDEVHLVGGAQFAVDDFNGDGFSDLVTTMPFDLRAEERLAAIVVLFGGSQGLGSAGRQIIVDPMGRRLRPRFGSVGSSGDLDGDGYAELLIGDSSAVDGDGALYIYHGHSSGLIVPADAVISSGLIPGSDFPGSHDGVGDINGDRIGDYLVGNDGSIHIFRGIRTSGLQYSRSIPVPEPDRASGGLRFGGRVTAGPDLNGDGLAELVLQCSHCGPVDWMDLDFGRGRVYLFTQALNDSWVPIPTLTILGANDAWDHSSSFGTHIAVGDYDGDGFDDLAIGDPESWEQWARPYRGKIHIVFGGQSISSLRRSLVYGESVPSVASSGIGDTLASSGPPAFIGAGG
ncbi:MAG: FG-GAP and VCBS repeat-containing protein [Polyangiales bacterium]